MTVRQAEQAEQLVGPVGLVAPLDAPAPPPAPPADEVWHLPGGTAWVYYGAGNTRLTRPVVLADGFHVGASDLDLFYDSLERGRFPFAGELRRRGRDLVLVGYADRSASILTNAGPAIAAILRAGEHLTGDGKLLVGGFGMGGLVTRYALAKLEAAGVDHRTATYLSYDTPHRGAWVPLCLQAFAHFLRFADRTLSDQINSPACRQMLWRHLERIDGLALQDPLRGEFLAELRDVGWWPRIPRRVGVSNGTGNGIGNGTPAGIEALHAIGSPFRGTILYTQAGGDHRRIATLSLLGREIHLVHTDGLSEVDGAPGGTLETLGRLADRLTEQGDVVLPLRTACFVPTVSAVAIRDLDDDLDLYADIDHLPAADSELDDFRCADSTEPHAEISEKLCSWILDRLP